MNFLIGLIFISALVGMYQTIYLLNRHLQSKIKDKEISKDIEKFGSCCGTPDACTLPAKIDSLRKQVEEALPESIVETSSGGVSDESKDV
jgi:hypothetical protein